MAPEMKPAARRRVGEFLAARTERPRSQLWVRINPVDGPEALRRSRCGCCRPPGRNHATQDPLGRRCPAALARARRARGASGLERQRIRILPIATETPEAIFSLGDYQRSGPRLYGLTWGAEDLSAAIGAIGNKQADGAWTQPFQLARSLCLFGASVAGVPAFDTLHADIRDERGLRASCAEARRDGFSGKIAIHPDQVAAINECFTPSEAEIAHARRVVKLFEDTPASPRSRSTARCWISHTCGRPRRSSRGCAGHPGPEVRQTSPGHVARLAAPGSVAATPPRSDAASGRAQASACCSRRRRH